MGAQQFKGYDERYNEGVGGTDAKRYDDNFGKKRRAIKRNDVDAYANEMIKQAGETADRIHKKMVTDRPAMTQWEIDQGMAYHKDGHWKGTQYKHGVRKDLLREERERRRRRGPDPPPPGSDWRARVAHAQQVAGYNVMLLRALNTAAVDAQRFIDQVPTDLMEHFEDSKGTMKTFKERYTKLEKLLEEAKYDSDGKATFDDKPIVEVFPQIQAQVHTANSATTLKETFEVPYVHNADFWATSDGFKHEALKFHQDVKMLVKMGHIAVHILAASSGIVMPDGERQSLYEMCPYNCAEVLDGKEEDNVYEEHVRGVGLGPRQIIAVVSRIEAVGGKEAVKKFKLVLTVSHDVVNFVTSDLVTRNFYGMSPDNVLIFVQPRLPGYYYDATLNTFVSDPDSPPELTGTGYAMMMMDWKGEGFTLSRKGERIPLASIDGAGPSTGYDWLQDKKVDWLMSNRLNDVYRLGQYAVDLDMLAYTLKLHEDQGVLFSFECEEVESISKAVEQGSVVMRKKLASEGHSVEVKGLALRSAEAQEMLRKFEEACKAKGQKVHTCSDRYIFHLDSLETIVSNTRFELGFKMEGSDEYLYRRGELRQSGLGDHVAFYPMLDMSDITMVPKTRSIACLGRAPCEEIKSKLQVKALVSAAIAQDKDKRFQSLASISGKELPSVVLDKGGQQKFRYHALVCASQDNAHRSSHRAFDTFQRFLRQGVDAMHVLNVQTSSHNIPSAQRMLDTFAASNNLVHVTSEVVCSTDTATKVILQQRQKKHCNIVVMGSESLAVNPRNVGSYAIKILREVDCSVFVYKGNCNAKKGKKDCFTFCLHAHAHAKEALSYVCTLMRPEKDRLLLVTCGAERSVENDKLLKRFEDDARYQHGCTSITRQFVVEKGSSAPATLGREAIKAGADILVVTVSTKDDDPKDAMSVVRTARVPVLFHRYTPEKRGGL